MRVPFLLLLTFFSAGVFAQPLVSSRISAGIDLGTGLKSHQVAPSLTYYQLLNVGQKQLFSFGYTVKFGTFYAQNLDYITAPARLTRGKSGLSSLGQPLIVNNIDTVGMADISMTSLNLGLRAQVKLGPVQLGVSADILGVGIGRNRTGQYRSSTGKYATPSSVTTTSTTAVYDTLSFQGKYTGQSISPGNINLRLLGDNNLGTLSSEVYARVLINQRLGIKVGYQWLTTEIHARNLDIVADNNRFRNRTNFPYVAVTFPLFQ